MTFHDVEQNSDEWFLLRAGKKTNSAISKAMANYGKAFGDPAKKYAVQIAVEQITGVPISSNYSNEHMQRGHEDEPIARLMYENEYFCTVENGGFFEVGDYGCSPDGLVDDDGLVEIKSHLAPIHYEILRKQSYEKIYKWQLVGNMKLTGRQWIDYISYCGSFPEDKKLYVYRLFAKDFSKEYKMIDIRMSEFDVLIKTAKENILNCNYSIIEA